MWASACTTVPVVLIVGRLIRATPGSRFLSTFTSAYRAHSQAPPALPGVGLGQIPGHDDLVMAHDGPAAMGADHLGEQLGSVQSRHGGVNGKASTPRPPRSLGGMA
jgi:hypothetical protein